MADAALQIDFPKEDVRKLQQAMALAGKKLGKSLGQQVRFAGWSVCRTLGTSTRVAKKHLDLFPVSSGTRKERQIQHITGKKLFLGVRHSGGKTRDVSVFATGIREARKTRKAAILNFGLARHSWRSSGKGLGGQVPLDKAGKADSRTLAVAARFAARDRNFKGDNPYVRVGSFLNYAQEALQGGPKKADDALRRAAKLMVKTIEGNIKKRLEEAAKK